MTDKRKFPLKTLAIYGVARAKQMKSNPEITHLADVDETVIANIIAMTADDILNDNRFNLYISEKKIKPLNNRR